MLFYQNTPTYFILKYHLVTPERPYTVKTIDCMTGFTSK